jgi:hypothetical protein
MSRGLESLLSDLVARKRAIQEEIPEFVFLDGDEFDTMCQEVSDLENQIERVLNLLERG